MTRKLLRLWPALAATALLLGTGAASAQRFGYDDDPPPFHHHHGWDGPPRWDHWHHRSWRDGDFERHGWRDRDRDRGDWRRDRFGDDGPGFRRGRGDDGPPPYGPRPGGRGIFHGDDG